MQEKEQNNSPIKQRILQFVATLGTSKREFYTKTGISRGTLESKTGITEDIVTKFFATYPEVNVEWIMFGKGDMLKTKRPNEHLSLEEDHSVPNKNTKKSPFSQKYDERFKQFFSTGKNSSEAIPLVSVQAVGGFAGRDFSIQEHDIEGYYIIPKFRHLDVDFLIEVTGDSMMPRFFPGDIIACSIINNPRFIQWNKPYLIATREDGMIVKRLRRSEEHDCLLAVSDNEDYEPFDIPKSEIDGLARVVGVIHTE